MCGIAGLLDLARASGGDALQARVRAMCEAVRHRGPDDHGTWAEAESGVGLGQRRLAIIDLSQEGHQPMHSACGRYVIVFNGEVYNFGELRAELEAKGHRFRGHSDTEAMLAAIAEWGLYAAVGRFVGMFAFALWDRADRCLYLVRDRLGIKPLLWGRFGDVILFGSEMGALAAHPAFAGTVDREALTLYLKRNCVPAPHSIYREVKKLPPGSILRIDGCSGDHATDTFWSMRQVAEAGRRDPFRGDLGEAADEAERLMAEAVRLRMIADVPLGVFLSGGVDSATVAALMQKQSDRPVKSFSIGFADAAYDEAKDAARVARHLGTDHHELYVGEADMLAVVPRLGAMFDEPFGDSSQVPTYLVSEMARRQVTVALSGDGGDEMFGGYNRYVWCERVARATGWLAPGVRRALADAIVAVPPAGWDRLSGLLRQRNAGDKLHKLAGVMGAAGAAEIYEGLVSHWPDAEAVTTNGRAAADLVARREEWADLDGFPAQMMYLDAVTYLPDDILTKVDRASMAVALEARVPLLDHRVVAFAWRLPAHLRIAEGTTKRVLREVLYRHVPRALIERPKMGFAVPLAAWLRGPLRDWAEALLDERRLAQEGFFRPRPIRQRWAEHLSGRRNWHHQLWDVLMFQAWHEARQAP